MVRYKVLVCFLSCTIFSVAALHAAEPATNPASATVEELAKTAGKSVVEVAFIGRDGKQQGLGSGFILSADGLIATNLHVIGEARPISVKLQDQRVFEVTEVHASDRALDLAVLRITAKELPALTLGDSSKLKQGEAVVALGHPHRLKHSVVSGVVSGRREVEGRQMIQLAMPIEPGNSGGPLLDMQGRVHGLVTMKSLVTENLGFAVESAALKPLLDKPNPIPMSRWLTIGALDPRDWTTLFGARWQQRAGRILVSGTGQGFGGRSLCLAGGEALEIPFEIAVTVRLDDEKGAAGLVFHSDGDNRHYGFYPSNGNLRLSRFDGPDVFSWKVLFDEPSSHYRPGEWNQLKVRVEKERIACYVNDQLVVESKDDEFKAGKVGLAKFRTTEAEFKRFRVGKELGKSQIAADDAAKLEKQLASLPPLAEVRPDELAALAESGLAGTALLREKAKGLERRAVELRRMAADVHVRTVVAELVKTSKSEPKDLDLARAALLIARLDDEELEIDAYLKQLDRLAADVKQKLPADADEAAKLAALNKHLFAENGFHGSRTEYYHRANSYLNSVLDDREGLPITLSVLYMELGRKLGLAIEGVGLPGHFVVRHVPAKGEAQLIDVFEGGLAMTRDDAANHVKAAGAGELREEHLKAATGREIVLRMIRNLLGVAQNKDDKEAMLRYAETIVSIDPESVPDRGLRAVVRYETGRRDAALADLDWFLEHRPEGLDLERVRQMREVFKSRPPK